MKIKVAKTGLYSGAAIMALVVGGQMALSQNATGADDGRFLEFVSALQEQERSKIPVSSKAASAPLETVVSRKLTIPTSGVFRFQALPETGVKLFIDGVLAIDATGPALEDSSEPIKAVQTLSAGPHAVRIVTVGGASADAVTFGALGTEPRPLIEASVEITEEEAVALASENAAVIPSTTSAAATPGQSNGLPGFADRTDTPAFTIGGTSSRVARNGPVTGEDGGNAAAPGTSGAAGMTPFQTAALSPSTSMTSATPGTTSTTSSGGGITSVPSSTGGGTTTPNGAGNPGTPGTPTASPTPPSAPAPTPVPTPTPINPNMLPTAETVQTSPLSPPVGAEVTQAVQLTSAGNVNGQVPNTGATLFGAVMSTSVFDIVNVQLSGSNRTTTVDVGPMTGQFAVRLFPEDFDANNQVQVTLTGANSASAEVEATPVSYTLTAMPVQDGVSQALSRLTFGATPDLYARVRSIGFQNFVEEQLNPDSINDAAFNALNPEAILSPTERQLNRFLIDLTHYEMAHAAFSEKQLQNVMGQFWANHFHAVTKDSGIHAQNIDDRKFFRDNAFGNFGEMLLYSARSPLMSQFLDNDQNRFRAGRENDGINENYGREILELSTVGVEAGYTPADVDMVSRVFSGWRYERTNPNADDVAGIYEFAFFPEDHDPQDKLIPFLNIVIPGRDDATGVQEGEELIAILANHPSTQSRTCRKIVQLLVSDTPPDAFVQSCVAAWGDGGDVEAMLRAILLDPAYITVAEYQRNKAKTPFEYAVSVIRAFGARPDNPTEDGFWNRFRDAYEDSGHDFLRFPVPTGLPEVASAWLNSATMVSAYNKITEVAERRENYGIDLNADLTDAGLETAEEVAAYLLAVSTADNYTLPEYEELVAVLKGEDGIFEPLVQDENRALEKAMGMIVVSPSFQLQ